MRPWWNLATSLLAASAFGLACLARLAAILLPDMTVTRDLLPDMAFTQEQLHALQLSPLPPPERPGRPLPVSLGAPEERMAALRRKIELLEQRQPRCRELQIISGGQEKTLLVDEQGIPCK
jgi:hypothetical protein